MKGLLRQASIPLSVCFSYHKSRIAIKHLQSPFPELWESSSKRFSYGFPAEYFSKKDCSEIDSAPVAASCSAGLGSKNRMKVAFCLLLQLGPNPAVFTSHPVLSNR